MVYKAPHPGAFFMRKNKRREVVVLPRQRSPNRDKAQQIWLESGQTLLLKDIAAELGVSESQIRKWKNQDQWERSGKVTLPNTKSNVTKPHGGQPGNKNAVGHGAPLRNKNAEKHGFYSKWLPEETLEIFEAIDDMNPIDIQWAGIKAQWTGIIRAQHIMYVRDQDDLSKEMSMTGDSVTAWDVQQAWDKQAKFLQAQSKAMSELRSMIKQYEEMLRSDLTTEEQRMRIAKLKAETGRLTGEGLETEDISEIEGDIYGG